MNEGASMPIIGRIIPRFIAGVKTTVRLGRSGGVVVSPAYHPEFSWLCFSRSFPRKARTVFVFLAFLIIVVAITLSSNYDIDNDSASMVIRGDEARSDAQPDQTVGQATGPATVDRFRLLNGYKPTCEGPLWSYIDESCMKKTRKKRRPRAVNGLAAIATLSLGRRALETTSSMEPLDQTGAAKTALLAPDVIDPPDLPKSAPKRLQRPSHRRTNGRNLRRDWSWRDNTWSARGRVYYPFRRDERPWGW
jgi:hypothetical protein